MVIITQAHGQSPLSRVCKLRLKCIPAFMTLQISFSNEFIIYLTIDSGDLLSGSFSRWIIKPVLTKYEFSSSQICGFQSCFLYKTEDKQRSCTWNTAATYLIMHEPQVVVFGYKGHPNKALTKSWLPGWLWTLKLKRIPQKTCFIEDDRDYTRDMNETVQVFVQ